MKAHENGRTSLDRRLGFFFHDSGYRESFLQVPRAHLLVVTILHSVTVSEHYLSNTCLLTSSQCPNFPGLFTSKPLN